ncbi:MAG: hypothetical protein KAT28_05455 [Candidatus Aenigmarchaeota archaeon]|nr:hypothetical protein [Candidatus Aenigmarchaeota archaeon]
MNKIEQIREELEILSNEKLLEDIIKSSEEMKEGKLLGWNEFEKAVKE